MRGVVAVIVNPNGAVVASAADFGGVDAAGFGLDSEQARRARSMVILEFARAHLNEWLAKEINGYEAKTIWEVASRAGYSLTVLPVVEQPA